jgi:large conductance mechanosensitive channel
MWADFKAFAIRGNLIELAVAFVMGVAFTAVVISFVNDILMQLVAAVFGRPDFSALSFTLNDSEIRYGSFLTALLVLMQVAVALFFLLKVIERLRREDEEESTVEPLEDILLLREIRDALVADQSAADRTVNRDV